MMEISSSAKFLAISKKPFSQKLFTLDLDNEMFDWM